MKSREARISELLGQVEHNTNASIELLEFAAVYLKDPDRMPDDLADYLASAFKHAASTPKTKDGKRIEGERTARERIERLAYGLGMLGKEGRPRKSIPKGDLFLSVALLGDTVTETSLTNAIHKVYKKTEYAIGKTTIRKLLQETKAKQPVILDSARHQMRKLMKSNGLKSLVRMRKFSDSKK